MSSESREAPTSLRRSRRASHDVRAFVRAWWTRFHGLFGKERKDRELAAELETHLEMHIEENVRRGMTPEAARRDALIKLGGLDQTTEKYRERRGIPFLESLLQDVRFGLRMLRKSPGFTVVAVVTLALGIGANTAIFSVVNGVLIQPLPFRNPRPLVMLWEGFHGAGFAKFAFSPPDLMFVERVQHSFEEIGAFENKELNISDRGEPERVMAARVSASLFPMLGAYPLLGRIFTREEDAPGRNVALISYGLWQRRYGSDKAIIGRTVELDRQAYSVIGVMPANFVFPVPGPIVNHQPADVWVPMAFTPQELQGWGQFYNQSVVARLRPNTTLASARSEAESISGELMARYPPVVAGAFRGAKVVIGVYSFQQEASGQVRTLLLVLMTAVAFLLLIACANVATLVLSRAAVRQRELAVRASLGATGRRLLRQSLTESLLVAAGGGTVGFLLGIFGQRLLFLLLPEGVPLPQRLPMDSSVPIFAIVTSTLTAVLFGILPALQISSLHLQDTLKETSQVIAGRRTRHLTRRLLVSLECALAIVLLIGAGLLIRSFARLVGTYPGFRADHVLTMGLPLPYQSYPKAFQIRTFYSDLLENVRGMPLVSSAGFSNDLPLENRDMEAFEIEGQGATGNNPIATSWVAGNYFETMGISLVRGRLFTPEDRLDTQRVLVISETLARRYWPNQDAIGKRVRWGIGPQVPWRTVVGIVGDVNDTVLGRSLRAHIYMAFSQAADEFVQDNVVGMWRSMNLTVRTTEEPNLLAPAVLARIHSLDPTLAAVHVRTMAQVESTSFAGPKFSAWLLGVFAGVALLLAVIGVYGVLAYAVAERTHEIGIRMALGAGWREIVRSVLGEGLRLVGIGATAGIAGALILTRLMGALLYEVTPTDPITFASVVLLILAIALLACYIPARRAAKVDPMVALRYE